MLLYLQTENIKAGPKQRTVRDRAMLKCDASRIGLTRTSSFSVRRSSPKPDLDHPPSHFIPECLPWRVIPTFFLVPWDFTTQSKRYPRQLSATPHEPAQHTVTVFPPVDEPEFVQRHVLALPLWVFLL
jgi:hypothetical protein